MKTNAYKSEYKGQEAVSIETGSILAQFLPLIGSKMCSLVYKPLGSELLVQRPGKEYLLEPYGGDYVAAECSGFDDMFPTIDKCFYETYPWQGTPIPDHGEVWSIPWDCSVEDDGLRFVTCGVRFPYKLEKWVYFADDTILRIDYRLSNLSSFDFDFMWAGHPMFYLEEGCELVLPPGVKGIVSTLSYSGALGRYGDEFAWPTFRLPDGTERDLRRIRPEKTKDAEKYFVKGKMPEGWCALKYRQSDFTLALSFPVAQVPYLAILPNEGGWQDLYNIFLEPCTASFDRLDVAKLHGEFSTVKAKSVYEWHLNLTIAGGTDFDRVSEEGRLIRR
jgi:hypothetical protein